MPWTHRLPQDRDVDERPRGFPHLWEHPAWKEYDAAVFTGGIDIGMKVHIKLANGAEFHQPCKIVKWTRRDGSIIVPIQPK